MTTYYLSSVDGSDSDNGTTWDLAKATFAGALAVATSNGDIIKVSHVHQEELAADTTFTPGANITVISVNRASSDVAAAMGTGGWIGNSTTNRYIRIGGADKVCLFHGLTFRTAGSTADQIRTAEVSGATNTYTNCYFWIGNTAADATLLQFGTDGAGTTILRNCTFRFGHASQGIMCKSAANLFNCSISADGAIPSTLFSNNSTFSGPVRCVGCDFSQITGTVVGNIGCLQQFFLERCTFGTAATLFGTQTSNPNLDSAEAWFADCLVGTTRVTGYYNGIGSAVRETGIYYTGSEAGSECWKVVTTANASFRAPFRTQWIDWYNTGTSAITPRFEILRNGSTTAYTNAEIWAEFSWKNTASSPLASGLQDDMQAIDAFIAGTAGADQAAGAGTGAWTGDSGAWSGKCDSGSAITPTEAGYLRGRICVAGGSLTVYVDPVIRTN